MDIALISKALKERAGIGKVFQIILAVSLLLNIIQGIINVSSDKIVRDIFIPPTIDKSFWVDGRSLGKDYLEQMGHWVVQLQASVTPLSIDQHNAQLLKYVHPSVFGPLSVRLEAGARKIKKDTLSTFFSPREIRISEKGQAVAFIGTKQTWVSDKRAPDAQTAYIVIFDYDGGKTYVKELRETDPKSPFAIPDAVATADYEYETELRRDTGQSDEFDQAGLDEKQFRGRTGEPGVSPPEIAHQSAMSLPYQGLPPPPQPSNREAVDQLQDEFDSLPTN